MTQAKTISFNKAELRTLIDACRAAIDYHRMFSLPEFEEGDEETLRKLGYDWDEEEENLDLDPLFEKAEAEVLSRIESYERMLNRLHDEVEAL
jgi:hypothetical protein